MNIQDVLVTTQATISGIDPLKFGIFFFGSIFLFLFYRANKRKQLDWTDLITAKGTTKVSLTKLLQLVGGLTATWVIMYQTMHDSLASEVLFIYLTYVGAVEAFSKFMAAKYNSNGGNFSASVSLEAKTSNEANDRSLPDQPPPSRRRRD